MSFKMKPKKVFVSGCFDLLHSGHVAFFEEASQHGDLYVGIGSDRTIRMLKAKTTVYNEQERLYLIRSLRFVKDARINSGSGIMDFLEEIKELKPDILFVNEDGHSHDKEHLCREMGIEYIISKRIPRKGLPARSTTMLMSECRIPYRIDLAGGWLDQPYVSEYYPGPVITFCIEPTHEFNDRSGMATSTRKKAIELWHCDLPDENPEKLAKILFCFENPPGTKVVSGSQDSLGIVLPGMNRLDYEKGQYWPGHISSIHDPEILDWVADHLYLIALNPRIPAYNVLENTDITSVKAKNLADAALEVWDSICRKDLQAFGKAFTRSFDAQISMFPNMVNPGILEIIEQYRDKALGWKLSGAGGGGYIILIAEHPVPGSIRVTARKAGSNQI